MVYELAHFIEVSIPKQFSICMTSVRHINGSKCANREHAQTNKKRIKSVINLEGNYY